MKKVMYLTFVLVLLAAFIVPAAAVYAGGGFDQYGYNNSARNFVGTGESWEMGKYGMTHADAEADMGIYAHDKLVMKWNAEWDRGNDENWANGPYNAWEDNEWNGMVGKQWGGGKVAGSGEVWHYKIVWVGAYTDNPSLIPDGAYGIWGQFVVLMDHGKAPGSGPGQIWGARAGQAGYGAYSSH